MEESLTCKGWKLALMGGHKGYKAIWSAVDFSGYLTSEIDGYVEEYCWSHERVGP